MKKIMIFLMSMSSFLFAAPVGNPLNPEIIAEGFFISPASWINFRLGYEGNFEYDGRMEKKPNGGKIDNLKQDVNSGSLTINLQNRVDLYGILGSSRIRSDWRFDNSGIASRIELETNYRLYWAAGGKVILFQWGNTALSTGGRYSTTKPSLSFITQDGVPQDKDNAKVRYKDWQVDLGLAHQIDIFIPYIGGKYSKAKSRVKNASFAISDEGENIQKMKNRNPVGVFAGCTLSNSKFFMLSIEARFIDEEAISVMGELKF